MLARLTVVLPRVRRTNAIIDCALPVLLIVSIATGWIASMLGLTEFGLHKYTSMALLCVAALHVARYWRVLLSHFGMRKHAARLRPTVRQTFAKARPNSVPALQIVDAYSARVLGEWLQSHPDVQISIRLEKRESPTETPAGVLEYVPRADSVA